MADEVRVGEVLVRVGGAKPQLREGEGVKTVGIGGGRGSVRGSLVAEKEQ